MNVRWCLAICIAAAVPAMAQGQSFPTKSIRLIVPAAPGGTADLSARILAQKLPDTLGQSVVVENRAGAGGIIGSETLVKSPPDGHTLVLGNIGPNAINYSLYSKLPYEAKDFAPVALVLSVPNVLVVPVGLPVQSVAQLVAMAKAKPGQVAFASSGTGQSIHLSGELFKLSTGLDIVHVPYKGAGPAVADLVAGQVAMMFDNIPSSMPHIRSGKLRPLAVTSSARLEQMPEVPTMIEAGYPGFVVTAWFGVLAPAKTPDAVVNRLNAEIVRVYTQPDVRERLHGLAATASNMSPSQFGDFIRAETDKWAKVVKSANLKAE